MKLGVLTNLFGNRSLEDTLKYLSSIGVEAAEIGCGGYPGKAHANPSVLLKNKEELKKFKELFKTYGITISALSAHGNPVHPDKNTAKAYDDDFMDALRLANELEIDRIVTFSGCPGDSEGSKYPNWVTCPWPDDFIKVLDWQWNKVLIPYWIRTAEAANEYGVNKICFEMHPGFCVYNPETLLKLRAAVGDTIGANYDPSHLFWQGIDPVSSIRALRGAIYHFHAKDCRIDINNTTVNGVLDTKHYADEINRSWIFRTVGYGHGEQVWRDIVSELRLSGYDHVMSIEHEDSLMTPTEGLGKAVAFLKNIIISEQKPSNISWA